MRLSWDRGTGDGWDAAVGYLDLLEEGLEVAALGEAADGEAGPAGLGGELEEVLELLQPCPAQITLEARQEEKG